MAQETQTDQDKKNLIEATLFMAAKPMTIEDLEPIVKMPKDEIARLLESMKSHYDEHGIKVTEHQTPDGARLFELNIKDRYVKQVEHLAPTRELSRGVLQTLSLIAYRAPMKQSEVVHIRGNRAYEHIKELMDKGLISSEPKGHTKILNITKRFLEYFGLGNLKELKDHFARIEKEAREKTKAQTTETT